MERIEWLKVACDSGKGSRENLSKIYNRNGKLIGTNGHRMHLYNGDPSNIDGYLDGSSSEVIGEYPEISGIEKRNSSNYSAKMRVTSELLKELKAIVSICKLIHKEAPTQLRLTKTAIIGSLDATSLTTQLEWRIETEVVGDFKGDLTIGVNLAYLYDALTMALVKSKDGDVLTIDVVDDFTPIKLTTEETQLVAYVSPLRLDLVISRKPVRLAA